MVSVKKNGKHVTNSPFKIMVGQSEIGDASKVKVYGQGLVEGHTFEVAEFIVDTRNAGKMKASLYRVIVRALKLTYITIVCRFEMSPGGFEISPVRF